MAKIINPHLFLFNDLFEKGEAQGKTPENQEETILSKQYKTLLFMTLAVTLTEKNEMPIVSPYTGDIPEGIIGIHRIKIHLVFMNFMRIQRQVKWEGKVMIRKIHVL